MLPVETILPQLLAALDSGRNAVLVAPPGAGKTTAVAPALLQEKWCHGQILLLSPRRLAARAAAERIAENMGEQLGGRVGYATRLESKKSAATRILVLTEGIFRRQILNDPELAGVSAVLFDEVHERSLDSDFGLALALETQGALRDDLRLLAMSATIDGARFSTIMGGAPIIESAGKSHDLRVEYAPRDGQAPVEQAMARTIRAAMAADAGDVLVFLPGVRDIDRTMSALAGVDAAIYPLHGGLEPAQQRAALRAQPDGRRKIILATKIAETSLTIDGVRIVVDSGLTRRARYDVAAGMTRLVTERASQASATQRAGRAARQAPGVAWRLWAAAATGGMAQFDAPEIADADLSSFLLDCALWGERDPSRLPLLDPPPTAALNAARARLMDMGALMPDGSVSAHGRAMAALPIEPRLAHMLLAAAALGHGRTAARVAVLIGERGLGGQDVDLTQRMARFARDNGPRARSARALADRWAKLAGADLTREGGGDVDVADAGVATSLALAFPQRVARRRSADGGEWASVSGRGFRLDNACALAGAQWLAVGEVQGAAAGARIMTAAPMTEEQVRSLFADQIRVEQRVTYDAKADRVDALRVEKLGRLTLSRQVIAADGDRAALLADAVVDSDFTLLPWDGAAAMLRARARFAGLDGLEDAALRATRDDWLGPMLANVRRLGDLDSATLARALLHLLDWPTRQLLDKYAPADFSTPAGSTHGIDYTAEGGPLVAVRVQALFGLDAHPMVGHPPRALRLALTSPAGRPIQLTSDLPGFWRGSWADVAREMRGRYPKHAWPDEPWQAVASLKTKRAQARG